MRQRVTYKKALSIRTTEGFCLALNYIASLPTCIIVYVIFEINIAIYENY